MVTPTLLGSTSTPASGGRQEAYEEALHYGFSPNNRGLKAVIERYKNPGKLDTPRGD